MHSRPKQTKTVQMTFSQINIILYMQASNSTVDLDLQSGLATASQTWELKSNKCRSMPYSRNIVHFSLKQNTNDLRNWNHPQIKFVHKASAIVWSFKNLGKNGKIGNGYSNRSPEPNLLLFTAIGTSEFLHCRLQQTIWMNQPRIRFWISVFDVRIFSKKIWRSSTRMFEFINISRQKQVKNHETMKISTRSNMRITKTAAWYW